MSFNYPKFLLDSSVLTGISIVDEKGCILFMNDTLKAIFPESVQRRTCWDLLKDDRQQCSQCPLKQGMMPGEVVTSEVKDILGGRSFRILHIGITHEGQKAVLEIYQDITGQKQMEEYCQGLSRIVEQMADSVTVTNAQGVIEYVNPAFETLTGYSAKEAIGQTPRILKSGQHDEAFYRSMWETILGGNIYRSILINRRKNGELFYSAKIITPLVDQSGKVTHFVSTDRDITEQKRLGDELAKVRMEEEKLKAIQVLSTTYAHHIFNAITPIRGYAEMMLKRGNLSTQDQVQWMEAIIANVDIIIGLVNQLENINSYKLKNFGGIKVLDLHSPENEPRESNRGNPRLHILPRFASP